MNHVKIVYYKNAAAYYKVERNNDKTFVATLQKYMGDANQRPPQKVTYTKERKFQPDNQRLSASLLDDVSRATYKR